MNILFWHPVILYLFSCLSYFSTTVCVFAPRRTPYISAPPFPSLTTSHLLDLIEFFPEEEMFPPNESVEILHSDKHDPIFRLIKESISLPCLRRKPSRSCWPLLFFSLASLFFRSMRFSTMPFFRNAFLGKTHSISSYVSYPLAKSSYLKVIGRLLSIFTNGKLFELINFDILLAANTFLII